jgi:hypothetical protein
MAIQRIPSLVATAAGLAPLQYAMSLVPSDAAAPFEAPLADSLPEGTAFDADEFYAEPIEA